MLDLDMRANLAGKLGMEIDADEFYWLRSEGVVDVNHGAVLVMQRDNLRVWETTLADGTIAAHAQAPWESAFYWREAR